MKKIISSLLAILLMLSLFSALTENAQTDLQARFGNADALQYQGISYVPKNRSSTMMIAICEKGQLQLLFLLAVDDDEKQVIPVNLDISTAAKAFDSNTLYYIYNHGSYPADESITRADADALRLLEAVNSLFPQPLIENYLVLNAEGLDALGGGPSPDPMLSPAENTKVRLKTLAKSAMGASSSEQMDMADALSGYLDTDVKTGAMMKIMDKAQRYEILPTQRIPGKTFQPKPTIHTDSDIPMDTPRHLPIELDESALMALTIEFFYEENPW